MTRQIQHVTLRASTVTIRRHFHFQVSPTPLESCVGKNPGYYNFPENQFKLLRNLLFWSKLQVKFTSYLYKSSHFTYPQSLTWGFPMFSCFGIISSYTKTHISDTCATGVLWSPKYKLCKLDKDKRYLIPAQIHQKWTDIDEICGAWSREANINVSKYAWNLPSRHTATTSTTLATTHIHAWKLCFTIT